MTNSADPDQLDSTLSAKEGISGTRRPGLKSKEKKLPEMLDPLVDS